MSKHCDGCGYRHSSGAECPPTHDDLQSVIDALTAELEAMTKERDDALQDSGKFDISQAIKERDALQAKLDIAVEALAGMDKLDATMLNDKLGASFGIRCQVQARESLAKIRGTTT